MNLSDELQALARSAPPAADPDVVVRLARVRRARRMIGGSALLVLVVALPLWLWVDGRGQEPAAVRVRLTFTVEGPPGSADRVRHILQERAEAMRFVAPQAFVIDDQTIAVEAGVPDGVPADWLATPGRLQIRKVLRATPAQQPSSPGGTTTGTPSSPAGTPSGTPSSPTGTPSGTPSSPAGTPSGTPSSPAGTPARTLVELKAKLGGAYDAAVLLKAPAKAKEGFAAFAALTPAEVALLPAVVQFNVPTISCDQLDNRPGTLPTENEVVACESGVEKYLLGGASVVGADVAAVTSAADALTGGYMIFLQLTPDGGPKWADLVREAFHNPGGECDSSAVGDEGRCRLAFVIDGKTLSAPQIRAESVSPAVIGNGPKEEAERIAAGIGPRELPVGVTLTPRA